MVVGAVFFVVGFGGYTLGVEPALIKYRALEKQLTQQRSDLTIATTQLSALKTRYRDPDGVNRAALDETLGKLAQLDQQLHQYDSALVPPGRVPQLLNTLLVRHRGLQLVSLRTLDPAPLLAPTANEAGKTTVKREETASLPSPSLSASSPLADRERGANNLFKHGIEIKVAGSYPDLLAYLAELEGSAQKLLWDQMKLSVVAYPRSELTLRLYTLSLESIWLVV
ncbi:hypothetical protein B9N43_10820 [Denitratisoma sp. DHT3]|nr:hypothetical protein B9N43_10820 [Denitratisoma sp. DHT3]